MPKFDADIIEVNDISQNRELSQSYQELVARIRRTIDRQRNQIGSFAKNKAVETYWLVGKHIVEHLLENKERAYYGDNFFQRLSRDVSIGRRTLERTAQFYRNSPNQSELTQLPWSHCLLLLTIKNDEQKKSLEQEALLGKWDLLELKKRVQILKGKDNDNDLLESKDKPLNAVQRLPLNKGKLHTYQVIATQCIGKKEKQLLVDCGFGLNMSLPALASLNLKNRDFIATTKRESKYISKLSFIERDKLFTYKAYLEKIIDGNTLLVFIDCGFSFFIHQQLRLRGIDVPEISTKEGLNARRFIESKLKALDFIIIKTYKSDRHDRYSADIFYLRGEQDEARVVGLGYFLNQELLNHGHATAVKR